MILSIDLNPIEIDIVIRALFFRQKAFRHQKEINSVYDGITAYSNRECDFELDSLQTILNKLRDMEI